MSDETGTTILTAREAAGRFEAVIARWHRVRPALHWPEVAAWAEAEPAVRGAVSRLGLINCFQWHLEDECRAVYEDPARMAAIKREIDRSNERRVRTADEIDRLVLATLAAGPLRRGARLALVTPGQLLDRLSIAQLKRSHAGGARPELAVSLDQQVADLCRGFDELLADAAAGVVQVKLYGTVKLYGRPA